jgi:hypothetical protein
MPSWKLTLDLSSVWAKPGLTFPQRRDGVVAAIEGSGWLDWTAHQLHLEGLLVDLADTESVGEFDSTFGDIYDLADIERVWIETH